MNSKPVISINNLFATYNKNVVLKNITLEIGVNERWAVIGKNGTGKSTLIRCISALVEPSSGSVFIDGIDIRAYNGRKRAQKISYVPQKADGTIPYSVYDFVMMGRYVFMGLFSIPGVTDKEIVHEALKLCDVLHLKNRLMNTLSGGELQRVLLAGAVAQRAPVLLLDEPTTFLDPAHERMFFNALLRVRENSELTIVMVTHDINSALVNCSHVCGLLNGEVAFAGTVQQFKELCPGVLLDLFGINFTKYISENDQHTAFGAWSVPC
ncbi:MAG: ABC transporter ATP-binding protein [Fibrobacter sp.]|nr:ABC transporter ATP-binding protein [Fibrobacter sp.]